MEWDGDFGPHSPSGREHMPLPTELNGPDGMRGYKHGVSLWSAPAERSGDGALACGVADWVSYLIS